MADFNDLLLKMHDHTFMQVIESLKFGAGRKLRHASAQLFSLMLMALIFGSSCSKGEEQPSNVYPQCKVISSFYDGSRDGFQIFSFEFEEDCIVFQLGYSGGCGEHTFDLVKTDPQSGLPFPSSFNGAFDADNDEIATYQLVHDDGDDSCQAFFQASVGFDLNSLRLPDRDRVHFRIKDVPGLLVYQY